MEVSMNMESKECSTCGCVCHKFPGILIALIGLTFLLGHFDIITSYNVNTIWPILLILIGIVKAFKGDLCKCCCRPNKSI